MRLGDFIPENMEQIIQEWQDHARNIDAAKKLNLNDLQDHARQLLAAIAKDLASPQTEAEQAGKSKDQDSMPGPYSEELDTASRMHSLMRFGFGFSIEEMVAEYRALRASVLRLWGKASGPAQGFELEDMVRFNESIDQAIVAAVSCYASKKEQRVRLLDTILSSAPDHIWIYDLDQRFLYVNKALADRFNLPQDEMIGKNIFDLALDAATAAEVHQQVEHVIQSGESLRAEVSDQAQSGEHACYEYILTPVINQHGQVEAVTGTGRDITERKIADDEIWHRANYDTLTGLPNRRLFRDRLEHEARHCERTGVPIALLFIRPG